MSNMALFLTVDIRPPYFIYLCCLRLRMWRFFLLNCFSATRKMCLFYYSYIHCQWGSTMTVLRLCDFAIPPPPPQVWIPWCWGWYTRDTEQLWVQEYNETWRHITDINTDFHPFHPLVPSTRSSPSSLPSSTSTSHTLPTSFNPHNFH
jgi:hypothetical protein